MKKGRVLLYADKITNSIKRAVEETERRRKKQILYNQKHHITPMSTHRKITENFHQEAEYSQPAHSDDLLYAASGEQEVYQAEMLSEAKLKEIEAKMYQAAENLEFEEAMRLRDLLNQLKKQDLLTKNDRFSIGKMS